MMRRAIAAIPDGSYQAEDALDDDGISANEIPIRVRVTIKGDRARVDFTGSSPQVAGALNAVEAITVSAVSYVFRCLVGTDVPASAGLMEPIEVIAPEGTIVNARHPASVAGGNVETSQRIVDTVFKALARALPDRIPAASQGTMNNLTIGGIDPRTGFEFSYYETVAGGMGARPTLDGMNATHTHMTNSLNTPAEALEYSYPLRVREYRIRKGSGGKGKHKGGDGANREIEVLGPAIMSLLSDRRKRAPYGLQGGADGALGRAFIIRRDGSKEELAAKGSWELHAGRSVAGRLSVPAPSSKRQHHRGGRRDREEERRLEAAAVVQGRCDRRRGYGAPGNERSQRESVGDGWSRIHRIESGDRLRLKTIRWMSSTTIDRI